MNEASTLLELAAKGTSIGGWALAVFFGWAHWRGHVRWGRDFVEQDKRHELEMANLKVAHAETVAGLKERLLSDTTGLKEQLSKAEKQRDKWESLATRSTEMTHSVVGAAITKTPGAEM